MCADSDCMCYDGETYAELESLQTKLQKYQKALEEIATPSDADAMFYAKEIARQAILVPLHLRKQSYI